MTPAGFSRALVDPGQKGIRQVDFKNKPNGYARKFLSDSEHICYRIGVQVAAAGDDPVRLKKFRVSRRQIT